MTLYESLSSLLPGCKLIAEEAMSRHTTFRIGGPAEVLVLPRTPEELLRAIRACKATGTRFVIIGDGANLLVSDAGIRGAVIQTSNVNSYETEGEILTAYTGARLVKISDAACKAGLTGLEFACGIPGTAGGAVYMNAGAYGNCVSDVCESVQVYDCGSDKVRPLSNPEMNFGYRQSVIQSDPELTVISAAFRLSRGDGEVIRAKMDGLLEKRKASQPLEYPSAGSVFKRPPGYFAGKLIQDAGLMGYAAGGAQVSEKHAGFIVNRGGATADDVLRLIGHIQNTVRDKFNVNLEPEIKRI